VAVASPTVDETGHRISVQLADRMGSISAAAAALEASGADVVDFALRRPSLDDVFFHLTGESKPDRNTSGENPTVTAKDGS
jgi:ABC-2 type transport system ATP-binding protein